MESTCAIRSLLKIGMIVGVAFAHQLQSMATEASVIPLWPGIAPGSEDYTGKERFDSRAPAVGNGWLTGVSKPTLTVYLPPEDARVGTAVVVCPGGGYGGLSIEKEGSTMAKWFAQRGVAAAVLKYRHGGGLHQHPIPLNDAQRALRLVRSRADAWQLDIDSIGILGFSAGGHLAASAGTHFDKGQADATDPIERESCQPNFMVLVYPVISMKEELTNPGSRRNLLGQSPPKDLVRLMSNEMQVTADTCPTFITHAADDKAVPVENAVELYRALRKQNVPAEMHLYEIGGHGYGFYRGDRPADRWPDLLEVWLKGHGLM
ncbi:MAG: alpha/beta hydrolase [Planctomycetota bacterium]